MFEHVVPTHRLKEKAIVNQKLIGTNALILHSAKVHSQNTSMLDLENITLNSMI